MKENNQDYSKTKKENNQGFSLIELIISIVILVIIMVPLMNNFFSSMKMNREAKDIESRTNLAANIMEGLKSLSMEETLSQFNGTNTDFTLLDMGVNAETLIYTDVMRLQKVSEVPAVYREYVTGGVEESGISYFAINGIKEENSTAYDVLITMNAKAYRYDSDEATSHGGYLMNNYKMPDIITLDNTINGMLFSNGVADNDTLDANALSTFTNWGVAYARSLWEQSDQLPYLEAYGKWDRKAEEARMSKTPIPTPLPIPSFDPSDSRYTMYCDESIIKNAITKSMIITVNEKSIEYQINYTCEWPSAVAGAIKNQITYQVQSKQYETIVENNYLFYKPSDYDSMHADVIEIKNSKVENPVNFYLVKQASTALDSKITIIRSAAADNISIFTNMADTNVTIKVKDEVAGTVIIDPAKQNVTAEIIDTTIKDRIYEVTVEICDYKEAQEEKYQEVLTTLQSTKEE